MTSNSIQFYSGSAGIEVLRLSKDGLWANPEIPADEAAKLVLEAIDYNIKVLVQKAVEEEREACADLCYKTSGDNAFVNHYNGTRMDLRCSELIRARRDK